MSSYRPISNSFQSHRAAGAEQTEAHLLASPCFARLQSAYRCGHSTETALLHVMNSVYAAADNKEATILVSLDISAAFDTINHEVLISRLANREPVWCRRRRFQLAALVPHL